jgi:hypothetical protein
VIEELTHDQQPEAFGVEFEELLEGSRKIVLERNGKQLHVRYNPRLVTLKILKDADSLEGAAEVTERLVLEWDLANKGQIIPLQREALLAVPLGVLQWVLGEVYKDAQANPTK